MAKLTDKVSVELELTAISRITTSLAVNIDRHIKSKSPIIIVRKYVEIVEQFNDILKENNLDHYTDDKFKSWEMYIGSRCNK